MQYVFYLFVGVLLFYVHRYLTRPQWREKPTLEDLEDREDEEVYPVIEQPAVNHAKPDETLHQFHERIVGMYPAQKIDTAVAYLRNSVDEDLWVQIRNAIRHNPDDWGVGYHFGFGMWVRNKLRQGGYGEDFWPIWNLDDLYIPLIERASRP